MERRLDIREAMKALAHPGRLEFLTWLKHPERHFGLTSSDAQHGVPAGRFALQGMSQSAASQNLAILHRSGLLTSRRIGSMVLYRRNEENIAALKRWIASDL